MITVKSLKVAPIHHPIARKFIERNHYSGKFVNNSCLHFGVFHEGRLYGVMSFGSPMDKRRTIGLVRGTKWHEMFELNRMAFSEALPRNSESRCLSIAFKLIKKNYPHVKWILSFSDACQCGDGTIYRASGFYLVGIKENKNICMYGDGRVIHKLTIESNPNKKRPELGYRSYFEITKGKNCFSKYLDFVGGKSLSGFQIKYVYFLDPSQKENLTTPILPFSEIERSGAGMYKGKKRVTKASSGDQSEGGGAVPTHTLQSSES